MWICGLVLIVALVLTPRVGEARFRHAPEVDRPTIQEQVQAGGMVLPWHEREAYTQFMLERPIQSYLEHVPSAEPVFSDRGILDTNARIQKAPAEPHKRWSRFRILDSYHYPCHRSRPIQSNSQSHNEQARPTVSAALHDICHVLIVTNSTGGALQTARFCHCRGGEYRGRRQKCRHP